MNEAILADAQTHMKSHARRLPLAALHLFEAAAQPVQQTHCAGGWQTPDGCYYRGGSRD
jgi:hypothetical protein